LNGPDPSTQHADAPLERDAPFHAIAEHVADLAALTDPDGVITYASPASRSLFRCEPEEMQGRPFTEFLDDSSVPIALAAFGRARDHGELTRNLELKMKRKDGSTFFGELNGSGFLVDGKQGSFVVIRDITERRRTEELLRDEISWRRVLVEQSTDGIVVLDQSGKVCEANRQYARMLGYSMEEVSQLHVWDWDTQFTRPQLLEMLATVDERGDHFETKHRRKDGTLCEMEISTNGAVYGGEKFIFCVCRDITERKRADETLRETASLLKEAEAVAGLGSYKLDILTGCWTSSEVLDALFGMDEAYERSVEGWLALVHPDDRVAMSDYFARQVIGRGEAFNREYRIIRQSDGAERWVNGLGRLEFDDRGRPVKMLGTIQDITERKQAEAALRLAEDQLRQAQKMEAVGQLAGGIAHDFNNLLAAILGYADLLLASPQVTDAETRHDLAEIKRAGERASTLTRQILAFSRRQVLKPSVVSLNDVLDGMEFLLARTLGENIEILTLKDPSLWRVEVDVHQFEQVIINLALNARDAMVSGGRLTLETANVLLDAEYCRSHPQTRPGAHVMFRVSDDGVGMDEGTLARAFEPFFTTKEPGKGTGLGLAMVYGMVQQSQGSIFGESRPGQGASFTICLPQAQAAAQPGSPRAPGPGLTQGRGTILLVEDEPSLRKLVARVLGGLGYRVLTAGTAAEALSLLGAAESRPGLLLTDVVLPGEMQGDDLARELVLRQPDLPVLYMSGYSRQAISQDGRLSEGVNLLEKPFTAEALSTAVRALLE
jgi:two-component system, cell cycle sensor histidine kinase and response regulator CckA